MTYYEELGVESSATTEEIRRAYKRLTRLMHPDHQMDPELRAAAERQMRRLNQIEEILTNPGARADYDSGLLRGSAVLRQDPVSDKQRKLVSMGWVWVMSMVAVIILFAVWFPADGERVAAPFPGRILTPSTPAASPRTQEPAPPVGAPAAGASVAAVRPASRETPTTALQVPAKAVEPTHFDPASVVLPPAKLPPLALNPGQLKPPVFEEGEKPMRKSTFAGQWIYARSAKDQTDTKLYPPEYIEVRVVQDNGRLSGSYQARYFVSNRAVSPTVSFRFEGEEKEGGEYLWEGMGGARGKIELRLLTGQSMEVIWFATEMGTQLGLGSGSATLYRRQEP